MFHGTWNEEEIHNHLKLISKNRLKFYLNILVDFFREERDRLRIQKQDPLNHMSKYVDDLKRKREDENKSSSSINTKKSNSSISTSSSSSRIEQLRAER